MTNVILVRSFQQIGGRVSIGKSENRKARLIIDPKDHQVVSGVYSSATWSDSTLSVHNRSKSRLLLSMAVPTPTMQFISNNNSCGCCSRKPIIRLSHGIVSAHSERTKVHIEAVWLCVVEFSGVMEKRVGHFRVRQVMVMTCCSNIPDPFMRRKRRGIIVAGDIFPFTASRISIIGNYSSAFGFFQLR